MTGTPPRRKRNEGIDLVLRYMGKKVGENVFRDEIAADTGLTPQQVQTVIYYARSNTATLRNEIQVITSGRVWRYVPRPPEPVAAAPEPPASDRGRALAAQLALITDESATAKPSTGNGVITTYYEEVGELDGKVLVRDEDGNCFTLTSIDLKIN